MTNVRYERLLNLLKSSSMDGAVVNPSATLTWLTGLQFHLMERPTVLLLRTTGKAALVLPELEMGKTDGLDFPLKTFGYGDTPSGWEAVFQKAVDYLNLKGKKLAVESERLRILESHLLLKAEPSLEFISDTRVFSELRLIKQPDEIACMQQSVRIAQTALQKTLPFITTGVSELQVAQELVIQLLRAGSQPELPFQPIVAAGPNSANPHAISSEREIQPGDLLVIDWGASHQGYFSDLTRTIAVGEVAPELMNIRSLTVQANRAAFKKVKPGFQAGLVDRTAREVIEDAHFGEYFTHRTGHGLGMEVHEAPYIFGENDLRLAPGMTFTIEPGIYLPGKGGARTEDNIVVTEKGGQCLSDLPREIDLPLE